MNSIKKNIDQHRIQELRKKIQDNDYVQSAILRIAMVLSNELSEIKGDSYERKEK